MTKACYINGISCISAQDTFANQFFEAKTYNEPIFSAIYPSYRDYIKPMQLRRLSNAVKMGVTTAKRALVDARVHMPSAIISATGMGCRVDSMSFLNQLIDNKEQFLSPTAFIQSTHNTVGGQIALHLSCKGYNTTYVQSSASLEMALIDTKLTLSESQEQSTILVGTVDELAEYTTLYQDNGFVKHIVSDVNGCSMSEGASFFICSNEKNKSTYAKLTAVKTALSLKEDEIEGFIKQFLENQHLKINDIDTVILGTNGDLEFDGYYTKLESTYLSKTQCLHYKHLCGEHNSASGFALWLASMILKKQYVPDCFKRNTSTTNTPKCVLIYNQYRGKNHSLSLVERV